ncbi:MAG: hypothetical protein ACOH2V_00920 [Candidatus Saccharimonadaceae bacterium]
MNIYLDIDDVIADWVPTFCKRYNCPIPTTWVNAHITMERLTELRKDKQFWTSLPVRHKPNFKPKGFLSARSIPKAWTHEFMKINNIPGRSNINQLPWNTSKIDKLKEFKCDIFIDDKAETFEECNAAGIFCFLMDAPHNQHIDTDLRIYDLNIDNITEKYKLWKKYM